MESSGTPGECGAHSATGGLSVCVCVCRAARSTYRRHCRQAGADAFHVKELGF